jgi:hypothetical protein
MILAASIGSYKAKATDNLMVYSLAMIDYYSDLVFQVYLRAQQTPGMPLASNPAHTSVVEARCAQVLAEVRSELKKKVRVSFNFDSR